MFLKNWSMNKLDEMKSTENLSLTISQTIFLAVLLIFLELSFKATTI